MTENRFVRTLLMFLVGGFVYCAIEVITRGFSHASMFIAGGICFVFIGFLNEYVGDKVNMLVQMLISTIFITVVELITGLIVNVELGMKVWDYSLLPYNYKGQICILFTGIWFLLSYVAIILNKYIRYWLMNGEKPKYKLW